MVLRHSFDPATLFCTSCGKGAHQILDRDLSCIDAANVIAISHILARKRGTWLVKAIDLLNAENKACAALPTTFL
jgi:hypothetical protein